VRAYPAVRSRLAGGAPKKVLCASGVILAARVAAAALACHLHCAARAGKGAERAKRGQSGRKQRRTQTAPAKEHACSTPLQRRTQVFRAEVQARVAELALPQRRRGHGGGVAALGSCWRNRVRHVLRVRLRKSNGAANAVTTGAAWLPLLLRRAQLPQAAAGVERSARSWLVPKKNAKGRAKLGLNTRVGHGLTEAERAIAALHVRFREGNAAWRLGCDVLRTCEATTRC
jgi:hypothetical protein